MKDIRGIDIKIGDYVVIPVSWGSIYLTGAQVIDINEKDNSLYIQYLNTPKRKNIDNNVLVYTPFPRPLILSENIDCFGNTINCGDEVMYRIPKRPLYIGVIKEIVSPGIYKLESGEIVKYVSVYKLKRDI